MRDHGRLGGRVGPRIATLTAKAMTAHLRESSDIRARIHTKGLDRFWQGVGREYRQAMGEHMKQLAEHPAAPEELRPLLRFVAAQPGEGASMLASLWYGTGMSSSIGGILGNSLAPLAHEMFRAAPLALLPPDLAASMVAKRIIGPDYGASEAGGAAIEPKRFDLMVQNAGTWPDVAAALEMLRRGFTDDQEFTLWAERNGLSGPAIAAYLQMREVPLQAPDLALMALRGIIGQDEGRRRARLVGVPDHDFDLLTEATGEPPGLMQLLEAFRRGFIDQARLQRGVRQSRVRNEWVDVVERLRFSPMTISDAVDATVQGHLDAHQAAQIAEQNGLEPGQVDTLIATAGEPIARGEALELFNRGEMNRGQVVQAIRESRVKNKYIGDIEKLARRLPPERTVVMLLTHGAISKSEATRLLLEHGFDRTVVEAMIRAGTSGKTQAHKHLAVSEIVLLHAEGAISEPDALKALDSLGYDKHDAGLVLRVEQLRQDAAWKRSAANRIGSDYVARLIDRPTCEQYLTHIGLPASQKTRLLDLWDLERGARRRHLTEAQVVGAVHKGHISHQQGHDRLTAMGYDTVDAGILLA